MERTAQYAGRQPELDIARGLAVVFMVLIHTAEYYWDWENAVFDKVANFLGSPPAAPVFMFLLGCGIVFSTHNRPGLLLRRGVTLLGLSYVYNALVYVLPYGIGSIVFHEPEMWSDYNVQIYDTDILQFAALAFLFFALVRRLNIKPWHTLVLAVCICGVGMALTSLVPEVEGHGLRFITGLFWGTHEGSYFPFTGWIVYPAAGYVFAEYLVKVEDKGKWYRRVSPVGGAVCLVMTLILLRFYDWDSMMDGPAYYHQNIFFTIMFTGFVLLWLGVCRGLYHILSKPVMDVLNRLSAYVTPIYVSQYALIIFVEVLIFRDEAELGVPATMGLFALYTVLAYCIAGCYRRIKKSYQHSA